MRVVSGQFRGRRLVSPEGRDTRPTTEKVREAVFNALGSLDLVDDAEVVDLYAGTGALGLEALSRGAARCTFVENDRAALEALRHNIDHLGVADRSRVVRGDALSAVGSLAGDLLLADPPYGVAPWEELLASTTADFVVAEAPTEVAAPDGWEAVRARRYGRTWVTFLERK